MRLLLSSLTLVVLVPGLLAGEDAKESKVQTPIVGNQTCPISGKPVKADKYLERDGERVYFCCGKCRRKAKGDLDAAFSKAYPADQVRDLRNDACPISGKEAKEDSFTVVQGMKVHFCCDGCDKKLRKDLQAQLVLLTHPELVDLGNEKCLVSGEEVDPASFFVYDGVLVRACCDDCTRDFAKDPAKYLADAGIDLDRVKAKAKSERAEKAEHREKAEKAEHGDG